MKVNSPHFRGCKAPPLPALWYSSFLHPHGVALYLSCSAATGQGLYWSGDIVLLQVFKYWSAGKPELATGRRCAHLREVDQQELPKSFTIVFTCPCSSPKKKKKWRRASAKSLLLVLDLPAFCWLFCWHNTISRLMSWRPWSESTKGHAAQVTGPQRYSTHLGG